MNLMLMAISMVVSATAYIFLTTHITTTGVTIFLHRAQTHKALTLHPIVSHFYRAWMCLTTGMTIKEWKAVHLKHHAYTDREGDPHSPTIFGRLYVVFLGVILYIKEANNQETLDKYGKGTPDDWIERNFYSKFSFMGVVLLGAFDIVLFYHWMGFPWYAPVVIWLVQMAWIPFWAAGVINGFGHFHGYRNFDTPDDSTNVVRKDFLLCGERLHNNHHRYPHRARFSVLPDEFDLAGDVYIPLLEKWGLAQDINYGEESSTST